MPFGVELPPSCGIYSFERFLKANPVKRSARTDEVQVDLRTLQYIGALQASLLLGWIQQWVAAGTKVTLLLPEPTTASPAVHWLTQIGFFRDLQGTAVELQGRVPYVATRSMGALFNWKTASDLANQLASLTAPSHFKDLFGGATDELISIGDLRDILLRELGDNALSHGRARMARLVVADSREREQADRGGFFAFFEGRPTVEVVVSDHGPGLTKNLAPVMPASWMPGHFEYSGTLSNAARLCAYALEFSSTSDTDGRRAKMGALLRDGASFTDVVPTGLFHVASLVRYYGGQLIIRTGTACVGFDYSKATPVLRENPIGGQCGKVPGTHVLVRIPKAASGRVVRTSQSSVLLRARFPTTPARILALGQFWIDAGKDSASFLHAVQLAVEHHLATKPKAESVILLLADGLHVETKAISLLLSWLGVVPHRGWLISVLGLKAELFDAASDQSRRVRDARRAGTQNVSERLYGWQPYLVTSESSALGVRFGEELASTETDDRIKEVHGTAVIEALRLMIDNKPVKHVEERGRYYLIEGKYYTQQFYELRQLTTPELNPLGFELSIALLAMWIRANNVTTVMSLADPLHDLIKHLAARVPTVRCVGNTRDAGRFRVLEALKGHQSGTKFLILTDVTCTADQFRVHLQAPQSIDDFIIFTFVDGRDDGLDYHTAQRADRAYTVPIHSVLKTPVPPIRDLPKHPGVKVLRIDPRTHAPTSRQQDELRVSATGMIDTAVVSGALHRGHIEFDGKHFVDFISLPSLFLALRAELEQAWRAMFERIRDDKLDPASVSVLYLDEKRGWEYLVREVISTFGVAECRPLSRDELDAPRPQGETYIKGTALWFILPVVAKGKTIRQCLEFGSRVVPPLMPAARKRSFSMFASIVLGRMEPGELSFYENVRRYKDADVTLSVLGSFPSPAFKLNDCPICNVRRAAMSHALRIEDYGRLFRAFQTAHDELDVTVFANASNIPSNASVSRREAISARLMALFVLGEADVAQRKILQSDLQGDEELHLFVETVGGHCDEKLFNEFRVRTELHTRYEAMLQTVRSTLRVCSAESLSLHFLLGCHVLFPDELEHAYRRLLINAVEVGETGLLNRLIFVALLEPTTYGLQLAIGAHLIADGNQFEGTLQELRTCLEWFGSGPRRTITACEELIRILRRSGEWGEGILEAQAFRPPSGGDSPAGREGLRDFQISPAVEHVLALVATIRGAGDHAALWAAIRAEGLDPDEPVRQIHRLANEMAALTPSAETQAIHDIARGLQTYGNQLARALGRAYTNPLEAVARIRPEMETGGRWSAIRQGGIEVRFRVDENAPGLLITCADLVATVNLFLENAQALLDRFAAAGSPLPIDSCLEFFFGGPTPDGAYATFEVRDNLPYEVPLKPAGGLLQVADYCRRYGAAHDFNPIADCGMRVAIRVFFRLDYSRKVRDTQ